MAEAVKMRLAVLASGGGSNAEAIWKHFQGHPFIEVVWVGSNRKDAGVLEKAEAAGIPCGSFSRADWELGAEGPVGEHLRSLGVRWLALAGFLRQVPASLLGMFGDRIVNVHPSLLPAFGGPGMYGNHVHEAVHRAFLAGQTAHTGMTIHRVNERYDEGPILFQARLEIEEEDTPASLAARVLRLEHRYYPQILQSLLEVDAQRQAAEEAAEVTPSMP